MIRSSIQLPLSALQTLFARCVASSHGPVVWKKKKMSGGDSHLRIRANPIIAKLDSPEFHAIFSPELLVIIKTFKNYNHDLRLAGGPVRDLLQGKIPGDIDIATTATPAQMKEMFESENIRMVNMNGEKHGTITPRVNDKLNFEITTLRIDEETDGRHAKVKFTKDWQLDANRRDLTINSMFLDFEGNVYDHFYGYDDLKQRRVAFVGNPSERIQEDYLRILRYFRFYGRISDVPNNHEVFTMDAIRENIAGLANISGERIWMEMKKTLGGNFGPQLMIDFLDCGAAKYVGIPENPNIEEFKRITSTSMELNPITSLVALLFTSADAVKLHERLKLSAHERDLAFFLTQNRDHYKDTYDILEFQRICFKHQGSSLQLKAFVVELLKYHNKEDLAKEFSDWSIPVPPLSGQFLKSQQCPDGLVMGKVRQILLDKWIDSRFELQQDAMAEEIPGVLESLKDFIAENVNKKLGKRKHVAAAKNK